MRIYIPHPGIYMPFRLSLVACLSFLCFLHCWPTLGDVERETSINDVATAGAHKEPEVLDNGTLSVLENAHKTAEPATQVRENAELLAFIHGSTGRCHSPRRWDWPTAN